MSSVHGANIIVEWSSRKVTVFDIASQTTKEFDVADSLPYGGKSAILAISRKSIFVRSTRVPNAAPEEIRMVVQIKLAELFPIPANELAYDFMLLSDINQEGRLALIMAMPVLELRRAYEKMASSGIKVVRTLPLALASPLVAESVGFSDAAVVEGKADYASVDLVAGGILRYSRVIPPNSMVDVEVNRTYNASGLPNERTVAAGGFSFPEASQTTSLSSLQALATGGADRFKVNIELPEVVAAREMSGRRRRSAISIAFLVFSLAAVYIAYSNRAEASAAADEQIAKYKKNLDADTKAQKTAQTELDRQQAINQILDGAFHPAQTMSDIALIAANSAPDGVWLTALSVERGKELTMRGVATKNDSVSTFVQNVGDYVDPESKQPRFRHAQMIFATNGEVQKQPVDEFSISAFPIGNLPLVLQQKAGVTTAVH